MEKALTYQKKQNITFNIVIVLLLVLWIPITIDKIFNFETFKVAMLKQPFSDNLGKILTYSLPVLELLTVITLITDKFRKIGLILTTSLMIIFTGYIGIALLGAWEDLPCACGSLISGMNWKQHLLFNLFFLTLSFWAFYLWYKLRGNNVGSEVTEGESAKRLIKKYSINSKF